MKNPELYKKTVDILYNAYFNDTLEHINPCGCAVGNLVAANCNYTFDKNTLYWKEANSNWYSAIRIYGKHWEESKKQIDSTGYTWQELAKIEKAFESADKGNNEDDWMYNGLCNVLEVLKEIHEVEDNTQEVARFKQHYLQLIEN